MPVDECPPPANGGNGHNGHHSPHNGPSPCATQRATLRATPASLTSFPQSNEGHNPAASELDYAERIAKLQMDYLIPLKEDVAGNAPGRGHSLCLSRVA